MMGKQAAELTLDPLAELVFQAEDDLLAIGCQQIRLPFGCMLRDPELPLIYDVNSLRKVQGRPTLSELRRVFRAADPAGRHQRLVSRDPETVDWLDGILLPRGYYRQACVAMVLDGDAPAISVPEDVTICLVDPDDDEREKEVARCQDKVRRKEPWYGKEVSRQMDRMALRHVREGGAEHLAAFLPDGSVAGSLLLRCANGVGFIADVGTAPLWRRRGIASALVAAAAAIAQERGFEIVGLTARRDDSPRHLYARLGFRTLGESIDWLA